MMGLRAVCSCVALVALAVAAPVAAQATRSTYYDFELYPTEAAPGASGHVELRPAASAFEIAVAPSGHVLYEVHVTARGLAGTGAAYTAWAAPPDLSAVQLIGELGPDLSVSGRVMFNKFIIFITQGTGATEAEALRDPILLRGTSRSGRMRSIFDHTDLVG